MMKSEEVSAEGWRVLEVQQPWLEEVNSLWCLFFNSVERRHTIIIQKLLHTIIIQKVVYFEPEVIRRPQVGQIPSIRLRIFVLNVLRDGWAGPPRLQPPTVRVQPKQEII